MAPGDGKVVDEARIFSVLSARRENRLLGIDWSQHQ